VCEWLMDHRVANGLYNLGTGKARSFNDLVQPIFKTLQIPVRIEYIDMPEDIRDSYQYFTEADMQKLRAAGYDRPFLSVEEGVSSYVKGFLSGHQYR
jgi:ADP-L-glycero-D-manno-heptose 6-epimerase